MDTYRGFVRVHLCVAASLLLVSGGAYALEPIISVSIETPEMPIIHGITNLPDQTEMLITVNRPATAYAAQDKVTVTSGKFVSSRFSNLGKPLSQGEYKINITVAAAIVQPPSVAAAMGEKGSKLSGPLIEHDDLFGATVIYNTIFSVGK